MIIANAQKAEWLEVEETSNELKILHGQEVGPYQKLCHDLRETDNGISKGRQFQHLASLPEIVVLILMSECPEVFKDANEFRKWLKTDVGKMYRTSKDAKPVKGDSLQIIVK